MDPTIELCRVQSSFNAFNRRPIPIDVYKGTEIDELELNIKTKKEDILRLSKLYKEIIDLRDKSDDIPDDFFLKANPFYEIGKSEFTNEDAVVLGNIDIVFNLTEHNTGIYSITGNQSYLICTLTDDNAWEYFMWRYPNSTKAGIYPKVIKGEYKVSRKLDGRFSKYHYKNAPVGDLTKDWERFVKWAQENIGATGEANKYIGTGGANLVVANDDLIEEPNLMLAIYFYLGILCCRKTGSFVCRVDDINTRFHYDLIYILSLSFDKVSIIKPMSTNPGDRSKYIVCDKRKEVISTSLSSLEEIIRYIQDNPNKNIVQLLDEIPKDFVEWLDVQNDILLNYEKDNLNEYLRMYKNNKIEFTSEFNLSKALLLWALPSSKKYGK